MRSTAGDTSSNRELREFLSANLTLLPSPSFNVLNLDITRKLLSRSSLVKGPARLQLHFGAANPPAPDPWPLAPDFYLSSTVPPASVSFFLSSSASSFG